jgi:outer membrane protein
LSGILSGLKNEIILLLISIILLQTAIPPSLSAMDLMEAYTRAKKSDALFGSAVYEHEAAKTLSKQGRSLLFPLIQASGSTSRYEFDTAPSTAYQDFTSFQSGITLKQSIFDLSRFYQYRQHNIQETIGDVKFASAEQDLILRVAEAYFNALAASDLLRLIDTEKKAVLEQLEQAKRMFQIGAGTITDVHDAEARYDAILSKEIDNKYNLEIKLQALKRIVGTEPDGLSFLVENIPLQAPEPNSREAWIEIAKKQNPLLKSYAYNIDNDKDELKKNKAQHLPTVDLLAGYTWTNTISGIVKTTGNIVYRSVGLQVSMPIFTGGYVTAKVQEAQAKLEGTKKKYEDALSEDTQKLTEAFLGVKAGIAKINALLTAVRSASTSLYSNKKGLIAGVRTIVDVLNAERELYDVSGRLLQARYDYLMNMLRLKFYAGTLSEEDVLMINQWLQTSQAR